jgi:SulP family sulfate permease
MRDRMRAMVVDADPPYRVILLDLEANSDLDLESADTLAGLREELDREGIELWLTRVHAPVREMLERTNPTDRVGEKWIFPSVLAGVEAYQRRA